MARAGTELRGGFAGGNEGAKVEFLLHALAGCVTTTFVLHARARGIQSRELSTELVGDIDLQGLLGLNDSVFPGYEKIRIRMNVKADCMDKELDDLSLLYATALTGLQHGLSTGSRCD